MHINRRQAVQQHLKLHAIEHFSKLFERVRFNIDEWICDLLHENAPIGGGRERKSDG